MDSDSSVGPQLCYVSAVAMKSGCFIIAVLFTPPAKNLLELIMCFMAVYSPANLIYQELIANIDIMQLVRSPAAKGQYLIHEWILVLHLYSR